MFRNLVVLPVFLCTCNLCLYIDRLFLSFTRVDSMKDGITLISSCFSFDTLAASVHT